MNLSTQQKQKLIKTFPELSGFLEQQETRNLLNGIKSQSDEQFKSFLTLLVDRIKVLKGEKGDKGDKPVKGVDYWTETELNNIANYILKLSTPIKGKHYFDGVQGAPGRDGRDAVGIQGKDGKDGSPDTALQIAEKLNTTKESVDASVIKGLLTTKDIIKEIKGQKLEMRDIKGMPLNMNDMRWHGGGLSSVAHDTTLTGDGTASNPLSVVGGGATFYNDTVSGTINSVNKTFTVTHTINSPIILMLANSGYQAGVDYTVSGTTITMTVAPDISLAGQPFWLAHS